MIKQYAGIYHITTNWDLMKLTTRELFQIRKDKKYFSQFPNKFLVEKQSFQYYNWKKALIECVNVSKLAIDIQKAL